MKWNITDLNTGDIYDTVTAPTVEAAHNIALARSHDEPELWNLFLAGVGVFQTP